MRDPNFISPMRSPVAMRSPGPTRVTTRRARTPTTWRKTTTRCSPATVRDTVISLRSLRWALSALKATRNRPGR